MNFFGYSTSADDKLLELTEVTVQASSNNLRKLASFLNKCAEEMESDEDWEHEHFNDSDSTVDSSSPDLIVFRNTENN